VRAAEQEFLNSLGRKMRNFRRDAGISQTRAAAALKLSRTSVTNIERGRQRISVYQLCQFAAMLEIEPQKLLP